MSKALALARDYARLALSLPRAADPSSRRPRKILVLGYAAVGDLIFLLPALKALREGLPEARVVFIGDDDTGTNELLPSTGLVDEIWRYAHARLASQAGPLELAARIAAESFDAVLVGQGAPMRPFARALLPIPVRVGHVRQLETKHDGWTPPRYAFWRLREGAVHGEWERRWVLNRPVQTGDNGEHAVSRGLRLVAKLGLHVPGQDDSRPKLPLSERHRAFAESALPATPGGAKTVGLHLGSPRTQYHKLWAPENWAAVARQLFERHRCRVAVFGGPDERETLERFRRKYDGPLVDLVGRGKLLESFAAIERCDLFLSSDTGPAKAAMALGVPTLTVWGPTNAREQGIVWDAARHADLSLNVSCSPCVVMGVRREGSGVINYDTCGHHDCLMRLSPRLVCAEIERRFAALVSAK